MSDNSAPDIIEALAAEYSRIKGVRRDLRASDRIVEDLRIDSISAIEMLVRVEELLGISIVADPRIAGLSTIGDILELVAVIRSGAEPTAERTA
ncbi:acyl carrier protein [Frankia sp. CiP3]|uniref:acyl carrier protein n=1 Tax=Frankia sp. CiP3 TaxID=2880971 RepID=UPI001EF50C02|nr:phosphopantetheine-binding protein [Frankia sp. CiP3]